MAALIYLLCAATAMICTILLIRAYLRSRYRLLLWSGLCFAGLSLNNFLLILDKMVIEMDLSLWRVSVALVAMSVLLYGLVWDAE
ncbi:MAG TPA: DUF5985 family protein [Dongiaceae bacterium]|nr:DUF5985 family protein [Dongiaceae bacterium]